MRNFNISATLGLTNPNSNNNKKEASYFITRGTTSSITLSLLGKVYLYDQIKQLVLIVKRPSGKLDTYKMFNELGELNNKFNHLVGINYDFIRVDLSPKETADLEASETSYEVEAAITIRGNGTSEYYTTLEKLDSFKVLDSLYGQILGD